MYSVIKRFSAPSASFGAVQDWNDGPGVQHAPLRLPRKDGDWELVNRRVMCRVACKRIE
jgi:hypothetical protein